MFDNRKNISVNKGFFQKEIIVVILEKKYKTVFHVIYSDLNTRDVGRTLEKLETTPHRVVSYFLNINTENVLYYLINICLELKR